MTETANRWETPGRKARELKRTRQASPAARIFVSIQKGENENMANKTRLKHMGKRGLSFFLALVMCISLVQITAFAAVETSEQQIVKNGTETYWDANQNKVEETGDWITSVKKTIEGTETENKFKITLDVKTTFDTQTVQVASDTDVVLVIDVSGSMGYCSACGKNHESHGHQYAGSILSDECWECGTSRDDHASSSCKWKESRLDAAKGAAKTFISQYANSGENDAQRNLAIVTFSGDAYTKMGWVNVAEDAQAANRTVDGLSAGGGTNTHAGLMLARNLLKNRTASPYVILLTDGEPTYAMKNDSNATDKIEQVEYVHGFYIYKNYVGDGRQVSSQTKDPAKNAATDIKNNGATLYTICYDHNKNGTNANWLKNSVATDAARALTPENASELETAFKSIAQDIKVWAEAYVVTDPMGSSISKAELVSSYSDRASITGTTLTWNVKESPAYGSGKAANGKNYYAYKVEYYVWLDNTAATKNEETGVQTIYDTNGTTTMSYVQVVDGKPAGENKTATFDVPQVKSLFANLAFDKVAYHDVNEKLEAAFTLTHDSGCPCGVESSKIASEYNSEYKNNQVTFENIPSGHKYVLEEVTAPKEPKEYVAVEKTYPVTVAWGQLTVDDTDEMFDGSTFKNKVDPQKKDLVITKNWLPNNLGANVTSIEVTVVGTITKDGKAVEVYRQNHTITGDLNKSIWTGTIEDLPTIDQATNLHIAYTVTETANDNYKLATNSGVKETEKLSVTLANQTTRIKTIEVAKSWGDESSNHPQVTLGLFAGNSKTPAKTVTLPKNDAWSEKVEVDAYDGNDPVDYTVKELDPATNTYVDSGRIVLGGVTYNVLVNGYTVTNTPAQEFTEEVSGTKTWVDGDGTSGTRPSITVKLYANGTEVASKVVTSTDGWAYSWNNLPKYALEDSRDTTGVLAALKDAGVEMNGAELIYSVDEEAVDGYDKSVTGNNITNTIKDIDETTDVKVTKVWKDERNAEGTRPDSVKLILHRSVIKNGTTETDQDFNEYYVFDQVAGSYQSKEEHIFQGLRVYDKEGFKYTYTVTEDGVNDTDRILAGKGGVKYGVSYDYDYDQESLTVTNALGESSDTVKVRVAKLWKDDANADGTRPDSISITVAGKAGKTVTLDGTVDKDGEIEAWVAEFELPRFDRDGKKITYTASDVAEVKADKYQTGKVEAAEVPGYSFAFVVTNELEQKYFDITVEKDWNTETGIEWDGFPKNAAHPDSVKVVLSGDGKPYPLTLDATNRWKKTENLPRYDKDGKVISYAVKEVSVSGYQPSGTEKANWKLDEATGNYTISIENTFIQERTSVSGQKYWQDGGSTANRPNSIQVGLLANGTLVEKKTVTASDGWKYTFEDLPLYSDWPFSPSTVIKYTVRELNVETPVAPNGTITYESPADGEDYTYTVTYSGSNIFNTRSTDTVEFAVNKVWIGPASSDVAFGLYQNGTLVDTVSGEDMYTPLNSEHIWVGVFAEQPKYDANGDVYEYAVKELGDDGAAAEITENGQTITIGGKDYTVSGEKLGTTYVITNKVEQEYTTIDGEKKWEGVPGSVDLPRSIQVGLYGENGQLVDLDGQENPVAVRADSDGKWTFSFQNVPVYALDNDGDGHTIRYTVKEVGADSGSIRHGDDYYTVTSGTEDNDYTVTNTYRRSDEYRYFVVVNYVTHKLDGTDSVDGEYIYQQITEVKKNDTAKVAPPATLTHDGHEFTYDADNEGNLTEKEITAPGTYKLVLWYERTEESSPNPKPDPDPDTGDDDVDIFVSKVWKDDGSDLRPDSISVQLYRNGKAYGDEVTLSENNNWRYTWSGLKDGYTWTVEEVDVPDGYVSEASRVGNRWIITNTLEDTEIKDPETPATDLPDTDVPTSGDTGVDLPEPEVPRADAPKTGDAAGLWAMAAAVSGMGLVWLAISGKKRKEEDA